MTIEERFEKLERKIACAERESGKSLYSAHLINQIMMEWIESLGKNPSSVIWDYVAVYAIRDGREIKIGKGIVREFQRTLSSDPLKGLYLGIEFTEEVKDGMWTG